MIEEGEIKTPTPGHVINSLKNLAIQILSDDIEVHKSCKYFSQYRFHVFFIIISYLHCYLELITFPVELKCFLYI